MSKDCIIPWHGPNQRSEIGEPAQPSHAPTGKSSRIVKVFGNCSSAGGHSHQLLMSVDVLLTSVRFSQRPKPAGWQLSAQPLRQGTRSTAGKNPLLLAGSNAKGCIEPKLWDWQSIMASLCRGERRKRVWLLYRRRNQHTLHALRFFRGCTVPFSCTPARKLLAVLGQFLGSKFMSKFLLGR